MAALAAHLTARGIRLAGFVQHEVARTDRCRCDIILSELASGVSIGISQDRGAHARGCRLDVGELLRAMHLAREAVVTLPIDLLLVNKFGKTECEGGGLRPLIVDALERGIPVLIGVPIGNIESWRVFADGYCAEHPLSALATDPASLCLSLGLAPCAHEPASAVAHEVRP
jgi:hypothetical protein